MNPLLYARSNRIVELMEQPAEERDADWMRDAAQQAVLLELATLPPYLCGLWSIDTSTGDGSVFDTIREIVFDEMSHFGLACNLLTTLGGDLVLADERVVPTYPGPLPGGVRPELCVSLGGLTQDAAYMYSRIEEPDHPLVLAVAEHTSIGAFYTALLEAFRAHPERITGARQLTLDMPHHGAGNNVRPLRTLAAVESAIDVIKEQGEGTSASPDNPFPGTQGERAHYYAFLEIFHQRKLTENPVTGKFEFEGAEIPMPDALPMGTVPEGGWPRTGPSAPDAATTQRLDEFNRLYSTLLSTLGQAWLQHDESDGQELLFTAIGQMSELQDPAQQLMAVPLPDGSGKNYGPEFRFVAP
ncbi:ferritin-like protein [Streptomyces sp. NRRL S-87]|uniref:ferritin-like domain-containing protein n=1 Tax=Streptomyces sp. NRRL S-87 TaxID=1463920 RepID=UPI0004BED56D|nr:ferritin-like protein [Streptomyces sp. NRRL S-87]